VIGVIRRSAKRVRRYESIVSFVPFDTMRMLFPLKAQNSENAISFINYRLSKKELHIEAKNEVHAIIARDMASIPVWMTLFRIGYDRWSDSRGKDF